MYKGHIVCMCSVVCAAFQFMFMERKTELGLNTK